MSSNSSRKKTLIIEIEEYDNASSPFEKASDLQCVASSVASSATTVAKDLDTTSSDQKQSGDSLIRATFQYCNKKFQVVSIQEHKKEENEEKKLEEHIESRHTPSDCVIIKASVERKKDPVFQVSNDVDRYVLFPIKYPKIWEKYKQHKAAFWTAEEIDLSEDLKVWDTLDKNLQHFIKTVLAFFAASDGIVLENIGVNFIDEIEIPEARCFYGFQIAMENIHSETYSLLIDTYIKNATEKTRLLRAIETSPAIRKKAEWAKRYISKDGATGERLLAFACVEGIFFSGSFCAIFYLKKRNIGLKGLTFSNELISRDEGMHVEFGILLYLMLTDGRLSEELAHQMIKDAVECERFFITEALPVTLIGMNSESMLQYIQYVADRLCVSLNYNKIYHVENPYEWMDLISLDGKTNFFEKRVADYSLSGVDPQLASVGNSSSSSASSVFDFVSDF
jgi:ribonucleoside-diphosphate reductase beta chain